MKIRQLFVACWFGVGVAAGVPAATPDTQGTKIEDSVTMSGVQLRLNGVGTRILGPNSLYVAGLYTNDKVTSLQDLIAAPGPKRLTMTFLREIEAAPFGKLLTRGVENNVPKSELPQLVSGLIRMGEIFTANKIMRPGESIWIDWVPGSGMIITAKGRVQGEPFKEPEFYRAMMSIWFGIAPADPRLKDALLGAK
ncbi:MAG: chalcone isomerase family protein [Rhodoferax sp.]|nr:chalcone isomerase family protein [Rhodoferax sp.]